MDVYHILVIILAVVLAVFLVLAIIATILIIKILRSTKTITNRAMSFVDNMESLSSTIKKVAGPVTFFKILAKFYRTVRRSNK